MNFDTFTEAQRASVQHVRGPLFIAAGAGSGKTFTLQQRIAYALTPESGSGCASIDEVLAITFTKAAAAEVKARVRAALRAEGMGEEALRVDAAWISTIHGMCSRILRENALVAGVNPNFSVISEFREKQLREQALETVLAREAENDRYAALFAEYGVRAPAGSFSDTSVRGMVEALLARAAAFVDGLGAVDTGPEPPAASAAARHVLLAYEQALSLIEGVMGAKPGKRQVETQTACAEAVAALEAFLAAGERDWRALLELLATLSSLRSDGFGKQAGDAGKEMCRAVQSELMRAFANGNAAIAHPHAETLLSLARQVEAEYARALEALGAIDNNGLLHRAYALLLAHPEVAARYRQQFKLVMVDEFQDTNQLQVDLIALVAGTENLCTVGDAQQSIYRFNGADVAVFERLRAQVESDTSGQALVQRLDDNFRSHGDVLAFVRRVCAQDEVFGERFLDLRAARRGEGAYRGGGPRIEVQLTTYTGSKDGSGAVAAQAEAIANRFAELRADGHQDGEMVVLLSRMTNADTYAAALRARGFACALGGGRSFYELDEVRTVGYLLTVLANPADTRALFSALTSDFVQLSADEFLRLATVYDEETGMPRRRALDRALLEYEAEPGSALAFALELFARARKRAEVDKPSRVLTELINEAGWLARLEKQGVEGVATAANVLKALRVVAELENEPGAGLAQVARDFRAMANTVADAPGSLSVANQNAVRIMTIHKSKGLEFPLVAVAAYDPSVPRAGAFQCAALDGRVRMALSAKRSEMAHSKTLTHAAIDIAEASLETAADPAQFAVVMQKRTEEEEVAEARRKFYVACTRASEYLLIAGMAKETKDPLSAYASVPITDDVRRSLMGDEDFPAGEAALEYGGSEPLRFTRIALAQDEGDAEDGAEDSAEAGEGEGADRVAVRAEDSEEFAFEVPVLPELRLPVCNPLPHFNRKNMFSYSAISSHDTPAAEIESSATTSVSSAGNAVEAPPGAGKQAPVAADAAAFVNADEATPSATDLGSAFHRVAQLAVERRALAGAVQTPPPARVDSIARRYGVASGVARERLNAALSRWFTSDVLARVNSYDKVHAEVPFVVEIPCGEETRLLEGEIDLLATDAAQTHAFVVDYKTGGYAEETDEALHEKHRLQATCYAYALLMQGYEDVEFAFVRVEQEKEGQPQVVPYAFSAADLISIKKAIEEAYIAALGAQ